MGISKLSVLCDWKFLKSVLNPTHCCLLPGFLVHCPPHGLNPVSHTYKAIALHHHHTQVSVSLSPSHQRPPLPPALFLPFPSLPFPSLPFPFLPFLTSSVSDFFQGEPGPKGDPGEKSHWVSYSPAPASPPPALPPSASLCPLLPPPISTCPPSASPALPCPGCSVKNSLTSRPWDRGCPTHILIGALLPHPPNIPLQQTPPMLSLSLSLPLSSPTYPL